MGKSKRFTERTDRPLAGAVVDRAAGVIRNVLVCGTESANGRDYPVAVLRRDYPKYEGRPVNLDHGRESTVARRFGWLANVRPGDDGRPRADFHLLKSHPQYEPVMEAAERNPALFGFSHVAYCQTSTKNGREVVESIERVESIDLVADPATTKSLFESRTMPTLKQFVESLVRNPKVSTKTALRLKALAEMDGMDSVPMDAPFPMDDAPEPEADDAVMAAFKAAISAVADEMLANSADPAKVKALAKKIQELANSHGKINADGTPDTDGDPATTDADDLPDEPKDESKKPVDPWLLLEECRAENGPEFTPGKSLLKALSLLTDPADRKALLAEHRAATKAPAEKPKSGRPLPRLTESATVPQSAREFAASVRD